MQQIKLGEAEIWACYSSSLARLLSTYCGQIIYIGIYFIGATLTPTD